MALVAPTDAQPASWRVAADRRLALLFVAPIVLVMVVLVGYPLVKGVLISLRVSDPTATGADRYVGLRNYSEVLHDPNTWAALRHTGEYLVLALVLELTIGLTFALALHRRFRGRPLVYTMLVLPWALPGVLSGLLWQRIFNADNGLLNSWLTSLHVIKHYHSWLSGTTSSIVVITVVHVWSVIPLTTLILVSGLNGIPDELYQAATVDGAGRLAQFRLITLPLLRPAFAVGLTMGSVAALGIFDEIYVLNGVALSTRSVMMQVYNTSFQDLDFGNGSALALLLSALTMVFGVVWLAAFRRAET